MSEQGATSEPRSTGWYVKNGILLILIIVLLGWIVYMFGEFQTRNEFNRGIELMNEQKHDEAIVVFEAMRPEAGEELRADIDENLAIAYIALSQDPGQSLEQSKVLLQKASEYDDSQLSEADRRILSMQTRRPQPQPEPTAPEPQTPQPAPPSAPTPPAAQTDPAPTAPTAQPGPGATGAAAPAPATQTPATPEAGNGTAEPADDTEGEIAP